MVDKILRQISKNFDFPLPINNSVIQNKLAKIRFYVNHTWIALHRILHCNSSLWRNFQSNRNVNFSVALSIDHFDSHEQQNSVNATVVT